MSYAEASLTLMLLLLTILVIVWRGVPCERAAEPDTPSNRPEVFDLQALEPYPHRPFNQGGNYHMTMGLRRLDEENWLTVDKKYMTEHGVRRQILANNKHKVLRCLPGSEDACVEVLGLIVEYLTDKYPAMYKINKRDDGTETIRNTETEEEFSLKEPFNGMAPLEIAARLVSEDINILKKGADGGAHHLYVPTIQQGRGRYQSFADPYQHSQRDALPSRMDGARPHRVASLTAAWHGPALGGEDRVFGRTVPCTPREHILCLMATDAFSGSSPESRPRSRWSVPLSLSRWSGLDNPLSTSCVSSKRTGLLIRGWCKPVTSSSVVRGRLSGGCRSLIPWSLA